MVAVPSPTPQLTYGDLLQLQLSLASLSEALPALVPAPRPGRVPSVSTSRGCCPELRRKSVERMVLREPGAT